MVRIDLANTNVNLLPVYEGIIKIGKMSGKKMDDQCDFASM